MYLLPDYLHAVYLRVNIVQQKLQLEQHKPTVSQTVEELCTISCCFRPSSLLNNTEPIEYAVPSLVNVIQAL